MKKFNVLSDVFTATDFSQSVDHLTKVKDTVIDMLEKTSKVISDKESIIDNLNSVETSIKEFSYSTTTENFFEDRLKTISLGVKKLKKGGGEDKFIRAQISQFVKISEYFSSMLTEVQNLSYNEARDIKTSETPDDDWIKILTKLHDDVYHNSLKVEIMIDKNPVIFVIKSYNFEAALISHLKEIGYYREVEKPTRRHITQTHRFLDEVNQGRRPPTDLTDLKSSPASTRTYFLRTDNDKSILVTLTDILDGRISTSLEVRINFGIGPEALLKMSEDVSLRDAVDEVQRELIDNVQKFLNAFSSSIEFQVQEERRKML